jgi:hypothetical protein
MPAFLLMEEADVSIIVARFKANRALDRDIPQVPQSVVTNATTVEDTAIVLVE